MRGKAPDLYAAQQHVESVDDLERLVGKGRPERAELTTFDGGSELRIHHVFRTVDQEDGIEPPRRGRGLIACDKRYDEARIEMDKKVRLAVEDQAAPEATHVELGHLEQSIFGEGEPVRFDPRVGRLQCFLVFRKPAFSARLLDRALKARCGGHRNIHPERLGLGHERRIKRDIGRANGRFRRPTAS